MQLRSRLVSSPAMSQSPIASSPTASAVENSTLRATSPLQGDPRAGTLELSLQRQCPSGRRDRTPLRTPRSSIATKKRRLSSGEEDPEEFKRRRFRLLQSAFGPEDRVDESSWITGTFIDLMLWKFASLYPAVHFMPTAFYHFHLEAAVKAAGSPWRRRCRSHRTKRDYQVRDVLGRVVDYDRDTPLVFIVNVGQIHWNLFRVQLSPTPKLQLFEPMGRLASRSGISYRSVPRAVIEWLDVCYPQYKCWLERTVSAITDKQQISGFDCGVACLLYADKCGRGLSGEEINDEIDQQAITSFRKQLQLQLEAHGVSFDG
ncbi:hypothetical protein JG687_00008109 [Phytophthora cactorum]|uniref:Ubiquitin-like protease family profile domain-containing protein n=3 Tax=Phytophthora cactorum TaxID=29920 RepID=A0A329RWA6_9STRA|nr:hypothetical protein Pcac1_g4817 [Phytophthora cactorum]KAG2838673.1 hypothetical protein PC112_g4422 [Phytophthora cactorum]KAG2841260.1 hypothetical protein PC111_g3153 [Phytophthora cactorum]KAG2862638.1 hypothetical protein PC113_g6119 [Phytophthora cactorum]KAG2897262.1 hypothetical protein PC114_g14739 [Phytophthora cactorum]